MLSLSAVASSRFISVTIPRSATTGKLDRIGRLSIRVLPRTMPGTRHICSSRPPTEVLIPRTSQAKPRLEIVRRNLECSHRLKASSNVVANRSELIVCHMKKKPLVENERVEGPNDPKLSDCGARHGTCAGEGGGGRRWWEACAVKRGAVRCSAWLGAFL